MDLDQHLQMSAMAGLLGTNGGASGFLYDTSHQNEITQTVICRVQSRFERIDFMELFKNRCPHLPSTASDATHVVVGAFYGAEAYCVVVQEEDANLPKKVKHLVKALKTNATIVGSLEGKCRLYCDLQSESVCECDLIDAFKQCSLMIDKIKTSDEEAIPISYLLCPLQDLLLGPIWKTGSKYYDVDAALVDRCSRFWVGMEQVSGRIDLFRPFFQKIGHTEFVEFESSVVEYQLILRTRLKEATLKARRTEGDEEELEKTLNLAENHLVFKPALLKLWLFSTYNEWVIANEMVNSLNGASLLFSEDDLKTKLEKEYALVLNISKVRLLLDPHTTKKYWNDNSELLRKSVDFCCNDDGDTTEDEEEKGGAHQLYIRYQQKKAKKTVREVATHFEKNTVEKAKVQIFVVVNEIDCINNREYHLYVRHNPDVITSMSKLPIESPNDVRIRRIKPVEENSSDFLVQWEWDYSEGPHDYE